MFSWERAGSKRRTLFLPTLRRSIPIFQHLYKKRGLLIINPFHATSLSLHPLKTFFIAIIQTISCLWYLSMLPESFLCLQGIYKRPVVWNGLKNSVCTSISERTKWTVKYRFTRCLNMLSDPISLGGNVWFPDVLTSNNSLWLTLNYWGCSFNSGRRLALGERSYRRKRRSGSFSGRFLTYYV